MTHQENELKLVFVELPKFTKQLEDLESVLDKWIYFIKEAPSLEVIPEKMREIPQLEKALNIANQASLSGSELEKIRIEQYVDDIVHCIWDEEAKLGSGSYAFFAPGEHERYQGWLGKPYPQQQPRVFFAGGHLGINHASVQGAIQTALAATIDVLENS